MLQEGDILDMELVLEGFFICGSFQMLEKEFKQYLILEGVWKREKKQMRFSDVLVEEVDYYVVDYIFVVIGK